jgi:hypothetical protein
MKDWLIGLYPRAWRERYGAEFRALLDDAPPGPLDALDILFNAGREHMKSGSLRAVGIRLGGLFACLSLLLVVEGFFARAVRTRDAMLLSALAWPALLRLAGARWKPFAYGMLGVLLLGFLLPPILGVTSQAGLPRFAWATGVYGLAELAVVWLARADLPASVIWLTALAGGAGVSLGLAQLLFYMGMAAAGPNGFGAAIFAIWFVVQIVWMAGVAVTLLVHTPADLTSSPAG